MGYLVCKKTAFTPELRELEGFALQEAVLIAMEKSRKEPKVLYRVRDEYTNRRVAEFQQGVLALVPTEDEEGK